LRHPRRGKSLFEARPNLAVDSLHGFVLSASRNLIGGRKARRVHSRTEPGAELTMERMLGHSSVFDCFYTRSLISQTNPSERQSKRAWPPN
jgi:hypothetical protein